MSDVRSRSTTFPRRRMLRFRLANSFSPKGQPRTKQKGISGHSAAISRAKSTPLTATGLMKVTMRPEAHLHRSEEHTSELQSRQYLVCRLLLEKKKKQSSECRV